MRCLNCYYYLELSLLSLAGNTESSQAVALADVDKRWRATPIYTSEWGRYACDCLKLL